MPPADGWWRCCRSPCCARSPRCWFCSAGRKPPGASSRWDGLRHMRNSEHGFYNWTPAEQVDTEVGRLGIENFSAHSITGRGVLLDVARYLLARGEDYRPDSLREIPCSLLDEIAAA